jgi:hypothetical protein
MQNKKTLASIRDFIISAEKSIKSAKKLLKHVLDENDLSIENNLEIDTS